MVISSRNRIGNVRNGRVKRQRCAWKLVLPPWIPKRQVAKHRGAERFVGELKEEKRGSVASRCRRAALTCLVRNSLVRFAPTRSFVSDHGRTILFSSPLPSTTFHLRTIVLHHVSFSTFFLPSGTLFPDSLASPSAFPTVFRSNLFLSSIRGTRIVSKIQNSLGFLVCTISVRGMSPRWRIRDHETIDEDTAAMVTSTLVV